MLYLCRCHQNTILRIIWQSKTNKRTAVDVAYNLYGPSPSEGKNHVIVLHGLLGFKRNWNGVCNKIAAANANTTVIATDARNHGDSPHESSHTYADLVDDLLQLFRKLSIKEAHIIGHSMGGRTGMILALTQPSKVASLVLVDISPTPGPLSLTKENYFTSLINVLKSVDFRGCDLSKARTVAKEKLLASQIISNMAGMEFILMNIGERPDKTFGWKCNLETLKNYFNQMASFPPEMEGKQYSGPTLFIAGGRSDFIPRTDLPRIKEFFPNADLKYIDNVGHNVHAEDPKAFFDMLNSFLVPKLK